MNNIKKILRCFKCGSILQTEDENKKGYIVPEVYNQHNSEVLLCNECYNKSLFYNRPKLNDFNDDLYVFLKDAEANSALVVLVLDLYNLDVCTNIKFIKSIGSCKLLYIINKADLLPNKINIKHLISETKKQLEGNDINILDCLTFSVLDSESISELYKEIKKYRAAHDIYFIGSKKSGKSSLLDSFLKNYKNNTNKVIQSYQYKGTNTFITEIPLDNSTYMYDVPGFSTGNSIQDLLDEKFYEKKISLSKKLETRRIIITPLNSFSLGGLVRIDLLSNKPTRFEILCNRNIEIHYFGKSKDMDSIFYNALSTNRLNPTCKKYISYEDFDIYDIEVGEEGEKQDLQILGLGIISFVANKQKFRITLPKGTFISLNKSRISYDK